MRILLAVHNAYTDHSSGAAQSLRTLMEWLAQAGHTCHVLCTARFDARPPDDLLRHLLELDVPLTPLPGTEAFGDGGHLARSANTPCPVTAFELNGVSVTMLLTRHNCVRQPNRAETAQYLVALDKALQQFAPDVALSYGAHPVTQEALRRARAHGAVTVFTLRNHGYEHRNWFTHADAVFTNSPYLSSLYKRKIGLNSIGIPSPMTWENALAPVAARAFVTFVNPSLHKGAALFARLADLLGSRRPDIPLLVVQSAQDASSLNSIPGIDFSKYPQIMASPPVPRPADFFALTKILLVPSVFEEPFGRVAAEALMNGIPPLVSNRGALPETTAGAGCVLPLPRWLTPTTNQLPSVEETEPWYTAVCQLWDDAAVYQEAAALAQATAERCYSEAVLRPRYLEYFADVTANKRKMALFS